MPMRTICCSRPRVHVFSLPALVSLAIGCTVFAAEGRDYSKGEVPPTFKPFTDADGRFKLSYPIDWSAKRDAQGAGFFATDNSSNLKVQVIPAGEASLEQVVNETRTRLRKTIKELKFISDGPASFGSIEAHHWVLDGDFGTKVRLAQLMFRDGQRLFIVSYGSQPEKWERHSAACLQIIASLKPGR